MKIIKIKDVNEFNFAHQRENLEEIIKTVEGIIRQVKSGGDSAIIELTNKLDRCNFREINDLMVSESELAESEKLTPKEVRRALQFAFKRIKSYHAKQLPKDFKYKDGKGAILGNIWKAIDSVGIYAPGGTASYPSSVLMSAVPAIVAGVKNLILCAPSDGGKINPATIYAAKICGISRIYKIGGAQAIAAMAYGTSKISKVGKIVGPGNAYVAGAKKILFGEVGIDMIAGPTDVTIIADKFSNPKWIAADALSQLEHGADSKSFVITNCENHAKEIASSLGNLKMQLPRLEIIERSIKNSAIFVVDEILDSADLANKIAPEHLQIVAREKEQILNKISNAGAIFLGEYTPEALGDYVAGPSHTLPTEGTAKFSSGLSVYDFLKRISLISCDQQAFANLSGVASILAECEGLMGHKLSVKIRGDE